MNLIFKFMQKMFKIFTFSFEACPTAVPDSYSRIHMRFLLGKKRPVGIRKREAALRLPVPLPKEIRLEDDHKRGEGRKIHKIIIRQFIKRVVQFLNGGGGESLFSPDPAQSD